MPDRIPSLALRDVRLSAIRSHYRSASPFSALMALALVCSSPLHAATFRVTTKIFEGAQLAAAEEHIILFDEGIVYDFPQIESRYVTVFDPSQNRVTLLDRQTQQQTRITTDELIQISAQARAAAHTPQQQAQLGLLATVVPSSKVIGYSLRFGSMEYHVTTQRPKDPSVAADFARFADLASRLNIVRRLGPPPFGRMTLNQYIGARSELPLETTLTLHRGDTSEEFRSTNQLEELDTITAEDRKLIDQARGMLAVYREVAPKDFQ